MPCFSLRPTHRVHAQAPVQPKLRVAQQFRRLELRWNCHDFLALFRQSLTTENRTMGRGLILWLVGIPLPIILLLFFLGYLS